MNVTDRRSLTDAISLTNAALDELGQLVGPEPRHAALNGRDGGLYLSHGSLDVYPHHEPTFNFKLRGVPLAVAWEICRVLGEA